jgi:hypothetical protein
MKLLSIQHFENEGAKSLGAIWGINTAMETLKVQGEVLIAIPRPQGQGGTPDELRIQQTWLPQELTKNIPRRRLLSSTEFRRAVNGGLIGLISEEQAMKMLGQSGAREEQQRLEAVTAHIKKAGSARTIADSKADVSRADGSKDDDDDDTSTRTTIVDDSEKSVAELAANGVEDVEKGISPSFKMWVDRLSTGKDLAAKNEIKGRRSFSNAELGFMSRNLPRKFTLTLAMVNKNLKK